MSIEIPQGGFKTLDQAANAISGIMNRSVSNETPPDNNTGEDDGQKLAKKTKPVDPFMGDGLEDKDVLVDEDDEEDVDEEGVPVEMGSPKEKQEEPEGELEQELDEEEVGEEYDHAALAQALGLDEDDLIVEEGELSVRTKVNGEEAQVSLAELKDSFQMTSAAQKGMQELAQEKKEFKETQKSKLEEMGHRMQFLDQALYAMQQEYMNDYQSIDWNSLKENDPEGYGVKRMDYQDREKKIQRFYADYQEAQKKIQGQFHEHMQSVWDDGSKQLASTFSGASYKTSPKWDSSEQDRLTKWMLGQGFPQDVLSTLGNWQVFKWARDSMLREEEQQAAKKTMKKVVKLPKVKTAKPSTPASKTAKKKSTLDAAKARQRKAGRKGQKNFNETVDLITRMMRS